MDIEKAMSIVVVEMRVLPQITMFSNTALLLLSLVVKPLGGLSVYQNGVRVHYNNNKTGISKHFH